MVVDRRPQGELRHDAALPVAVTGEQKRRGEAICWTRREWWWVVASWPRLGYVAFLDLSSQRLFIITAANCLVIQHPCFCGVGRWVAGSGGLGAWVVTLSNDI
jgi:hypothetical protein